MESWDKLKNVRQYQPRRESAFSPKLQEQEGIAGESSRAQGRHLGNISSVAQEMTKNDKKNDKK